MQSWLIRLNNHAMLMASVIVFTLFLVFLYINHVPLWHTDIWAHLKYGAWITEHGQLPYVEPFSTWGASQPILPFAWLSQVLLSAIYQAGTIFPIPGASDESIQPGGVDALRFVHALVVTLRFLFLYLAFLRSTSSKLVSWLGILFCLGLSWQHLDVLRPQVFGELFLAILLFLLCRQPPSRVASWFVPVILVLWANMHGSYLNGLLVLLGILASRILLAIKASHNGLGGNAFHEPMVRRTFRMFYFSLLGIGLFNPLGSFRWYTETLRFAENPNVRMMDEWQPLEWNSPQGNLFIISVALVILTQWQASRLKSAGISIGHGLLLTCFGIQVICFQRMLPWWAILCPLVCVGPWARILHLKKKEVAEVTSATWKQTILILFACWIGFAFSTLGHLILHQTATPLDLSLHPSTPRIIDQANRGMISTHFSALTNILQKKKGTVFCSETLGDYCLFTGIENVLAYSHVHALPTDHWYQVMVVKMGESTWAHHLNRWNAHVVVIEAELHSELCNQLRRSPNWEIVLDEAGSSRKPNPKSRLFIAVRKSSIP